MEIEYSKFVVDKKIYGINDITGIVDIDSNFIYQSFYDVRRVQFNGFVPVRFYLKFCAGVKAKQVVDKLFNDFELSKELLNRKMTNLSKGELTKILIIKACTTPEAKTLIFENMDTYLNNKEMNLVLKTIKNYKEEIKKNVIVLTSKVDNIIQPCERYIIASNNEIVFKGKELTDMPVKTRTMEFADLANEKGASLAYYKDANDLLKAIYRSVKK